MITSTNEHTAICAVAGGLDAIDKNECSLEVLASTIAVILQTFGFEKIDAYGGGLQAAKAVGTEFAKEYWKNATITNKTAVLMGAVCTAEMLIKRGLIDDDIRRACTEVMGEQTDNPT